MGTAREALLALLQDATIRIRKNFGMYGQIRIEIRDVTPKRLTVTISTRNALEGAWLAENVRNAVLNWLQDLLPSSGSLPSTTTQSAESQARSMTCRTLKSFPTPARSGALEILIEQHVGPAREELRPRFRKAWHRYLEQEKR